MRGIQTRSRARCIALVIAVLSLSRLVLHLLGWWPV